MTVYFDLSFQNQTINPSVGTYSSGDGVTPSFELVDNEYYLKNVGSHGYYHFNIANIPNDTVIEFDLIFNNKYNFNWIFLFESTNSNWWGIGSNNSDLQFGGYNLSELILASNITNGTKYHVTLISQYNISGNTIKIYLNDNLVASTTITTTHERSQFLLLGNTVNYTANCYIKNILITDLSADTTKYLNGTGLSEVWANTKNYISAQLLGKSDVGHTHSASDITSGLATVATSGSYNDLSNKPTIPTVNNATLTIQKNGTTVETFTANASSNVTANISVPTKTSELTNDSGFLTSVLPIGSYIQFAGSQAPDGFLVCNGGAISRTTYSALFAVIGTTYGSGDGSTTFNLPNLTDRFLQGSTTSGTVKNAGLPNITGFFTAYSWGHGGGSLCFDSLVDSPNAIANGSSAGYNFDTFTFDASRSNSIYGSSSTVQPPALTCLICIKY